MQRINSSESDSTMNLRRPGNRMGMKNFEKWKKDILLGWIRENKDNPYPSESAKEHLGKLCNMSKKQVSNWFTNARKRYYKLMNESKLLKRKKRSPDSRSNSARDLSASQAHRRDVGSLTSRYETPKVSFQFGKNLAKPFVQKSEPQVIDLTNPSDDLSEMLEKYCFCNVQKDERRIVKEKPSEVTNNFNKTVDLFSLIR